MQISEIVKKVKQIEIRTKNRTESSLMGQYHSVFKGQGMTFAEVRPYQFGDDIRRIDWNKTARFQEPYIKVLEEERELTLMLLVDISASMDYGTQYQLKRELVAEIAASIGFSASGNQDKVGLVIFADKIINVIPPKKGRKHVLAIISQILTAEYQNTTSNINFALDYMMSVFKRKSLCFLLSDFDTDFDEKKLKMIAKKHQFLGIRVYDTADNSLPNIGFAKFIDVETKQEIWANTNSKRWRYTFAENNKIQLKIVENSFKNANAGFININAKKDYSKALFEYFKK